MKKKNELFSAKNAFPASYMGKERIIDTTTFIDLIKQELISRDIEVLLMSDILRIAERQSEDVQQTLYMRMKGYTQQEIADEIGVTQPTVNDYLNRNLAEIKFLLRKYTSIL